MKALFNFDLKCDFYFAVTVLEVRYNSRERKCTLIEKSTYVFMRVSCKFIASQLIDFTIIRTVFQVIFSLI